MTFHTRSRLTNSLLGGYGMVSNGPQWAKRGTYGETLPVHEHAARTLHGLDDTGTTSDGADASGEGGNIGSVDDREDATTLAQNIRLSSLPGLETTSTSPVAGIGDIGEIVVGHDWLGVGRHGALWAGLDEDRSVEGRGGGSGRGWGASGDCGRVQVDVSGVVVLWVN
jgi:hypothetical protein